MHVQAYLLIFIPPVVLYIPYIDTEVLWIKRGPYIRIIDNDLCTSILGQSDISSHLITWLSHPTDSYLNIILRIILQGHCIETVRTRDKH